MEKKSLFDRLTDVHNIHWWLDVLDILVVGFLVYQLYKLVKGTAALRIFVGVLGIYSLWKLVEFLDMELLHDILGQFIGVGVIALIVVFQQEIRKFLLLIASPKFYNRFKLTKWMFKLKWQPEKDAALDLSIIVSASKSLAASRTGALMVIAGNSNLEMYKSLGDELDANLSIRMLEAIFQKESPLHDGAVIISGDKIVAARCVLPVSDSPEIPAQYGLRHRSAVGITEHSNATAIVVSEQNGQISVCKDGKMINNVKPDQLPDMITPDLE